jgi:uncharacterized protein YkwD
VAEPHARAAGAPATAHGRVTRAALMLGTLVSGALFTASPVAAQDPPPAGLGGATAAAVLADTEAALANPELGADAHQILELYRLINAARAEHGLYPLLLDARLVGAAQEHASKMSHAYFCRHTGPDGASARGRMAANGYHYNNWAGENILCSRWRPDEALRWWLGSPPHRRNLLHSHFTHLGIGYDPAGRFGPNWVLNFAAGEANTVELGYLPSSAAVTP